MKVTATAPLRLDIGGGVTDIPEIATQIGTTIANLGIDLFADASLLSKKSIAAEAARNQIGKSRLFINGREVSSTMIPGEPTYFQAMFSSFCANLAVAPGVDLHVTDDLPSSTGLGASATVSLCVFASLYGLQFGKAPSANRAVKHAHHFETNEHGIHGGFQDYLAGYFGGYNQIKFSSLADTDLSTVTTLGQKLPSAAEAFLNSNMLILVQRTNNISSKIIVDEQVSNLRKNRNSMMGHLRVIKNSNQAINEILLGPFVEEWPESLAHLINLSWEYQKQLCERLATDSKNEVENSLRPLIYALRGPGAGGNSLFLLTKPSEKTALLRKLREYKQDFLLFYCRVNNDGLKVSFS